VSFSSLGEFIAMGTHGPYVWTAYGISLLVLTINLLLPLRAHREYLRSEARRLRREEQK
jgi:heme exporter protein D